MSSYSHFTDARDVVESQLATTFSFLDDHANLSAHMNKRSGMMIGSSMHIHMDPDHTRRVGSRFGFTGSIFGVPLAVSEVVTERDPPVSKTWETIDEPRLWVIGRYKMGFELSPRGQQTSLRVHIAYDLPLQGLPRLLGRLFGGYYASWCTRRMVEDTRRHFEATPDRIEVAT